MISTKDQSLILEKWPNEDEKETTYHWQRGRLQSSMSTSLWNHWVLRRPTKADNTFAYIGESLKDLFWVHYYSTELTAEFMRVYLYFWITLGKSIKTHISAGRLTSASNFLFVWVREKFSVVTWQLNLSFGSFQKSRLGWWKQRAPASQSCWLG